MAEDRAACRAALSEDLVKQGGAQPRRALLVEAELQTLRLCRNVLEGAGFVVDTVETGIEAVIAARKGSFDLILVDLQLRDVPGREAIGWLRSNPALRSTPIIVLTASPGEDADLAAFQPAVALRKPVSRATARHAIEQFPFLAGDQK